MSYCNGPCRYPKFIMTYNFSIMTQPFSWRACKIAVAVFFVMASCKERQPAAEQWQEKGDFMGKIRHHPVTFSIDGTGYAGLGDAESTYDDFYKYNPLSDSWTKLNSFGGGPRGYAYGVVYNGKGYVSFGTKGSKYFNDLWEYNPITDSWKELKPCTCEARGHPAMVVVNGRIYIGMGNNVANLKDWWEYNIVNNSWSKKADLPGPARHHPFYFTIDGKAYVGLGHGNKLVDSKSIYQDFYQFDPETGQWKRMNDFPGMGRVAGTQFDYNGYGYILSGQGTNHYNLVTGEFWQYNPKTDKWVAFASHKGSGRWAPGSFIIDNKVYFTCGTSDLGNQRDVQVFDLK